MLQWFRFTVVCAAALAGAAIFACSAHDGDASEERIANSAQAYDTNADLISPSTCRLTGGRLVSCAIATRTLEGLPMNSTAVPLRTKVTALKTGNCSTQYPLQVTLSGDGSDNVVLQYLAGGTTALRRRDGQPLGRFTLTDTSSWTKFASFDGTCRISLSIVSNEPDVNNAAEAQAIVDALAADLAAKITLRDHYQQLSLFHRAFEFTQSVANSFLVELTNETIQQLRSSANDASMAIAMLMAGCGDTMLTDADRQHLMILFMSLPQLGQASDWQNDAGQPKTLADFVGPSQADVLATVQKLATQANQDGGTSYETEYQNAAQSVVVAQAKLDQAKAQLATWLAP